MPMTFELAQRLSEVLMALAFIQQSFEHLAGAKDERWLFGARLALALLLLADVQPLVVEGLLVISSCAMLQRYQGPYNGGSDRMGLLLLFCLFFARLAPARPWQEIALGYLAAQVVLSYAISGWVKLANPDWRSGRALQDIFAFSVYPVSESIRSWANWPRLMLGLSWGLMLFEALFPLALLDGTGLSMALALAALFHLINACVFGLNRFLWIWLAAYPCLIWFQQRVQSGF